MIHIHLMVHTLIHQLESAVVYFCNNYQRADTVVGPFLQNEPIVPNHYTIVKSSMARSPQRRICCHCLLGQLSTILAVMLLMLPNQQLPVAVDHGQLRTMPSERQIQMTDRYIPPIFYRAAPLSAFSTLQIGSASDGPSRISRGRFNLPHTAQPTFLCAKGDAYYNY